MIDLGLTPTELRWLAVVKDRTATRSLLGRVHCLPAHRAFERRVCSLTDRWWWWWLVVWLCWWWWWLVGWLCGHSPGHPLNPFPALSRAPRLEVPREQLSVLC